MKFLSFGWLSIRAKTLFQGSLLSLGLPLGLIGVSLCLISVSSAQEASPFSQEAESQFRSELEQYRSRSDRKSEAETNSNAQNNRANSIFNDRFNQPLTTYDQDQTVRTRENRIEATDRGSEFDDNPFNARNEENRFEANGGELRNLEFDVEGQRGRNRNALLGQRGQNRQRRGDRAFNQDTIDDREAIAELEGRGNNNSRREERFEEEFLAAERSLEEGQEQPRDINPRNRNIRQANIQNNDQQQTRNQQGRRLGLRRGVDQRNQAELTFADNNDITGSIRNNELENTYAAEGKRIGSFLVFPEVSITGLYSDNPTASVENGPGDEALEIIPSIVLRSDWARHSLELQGRLAKSYYEELTSENIEEYLLSATGRIDIQNNHFLELQVRKEQSQDSRGDVDNLNSDAELANLDRLFLSAIYNYQWNKTTLRLTGTITDFDYEDVRDGLGNIINNDDQDYVENSFTARLAYSFHSGLYVYVEGNYIERDYDSALDDDGFQRGSDEQNYRIGYIHDLTSKIRFQASVGYQALFADDARFIDVEDFVYDASINYRPTRQTSLTLSTSKAYDATDIAGTVAVEETNYSIALNHYFRPNFLINAALSHEEEIFEGIDQSQETVTAQLTLQYIFNRHVRLIAGYEFSDVSTNDGADYQENQFRLGLNLRP